MPDPILEEQERITKILESETSYYLKFQNENIPKYYLDRINEKNSKEENSVIQTKEITRLGRFQKRWL